MNWNDVLREPSHGDHIVHTYQDRGFLAEAVAEYLGTGLARGEAAIIIARPAHQRGFPAEAGARRASRAKSWCSMPSRPWRASWPTACRNGTRSAR